MKKFIMIAAMVVATITASAQHNIVPTSSRAKKDSIVTDWKWDSKYTIYIVPSSGRCFYWKPGNKSRSYLSEKYDEKAKEICKQYRITWKPRNKRK